MNSNSRNSIWSPFCYWDDTMTQNNFLFKATVWISFSATMNKVILWDMDIITCLQNCFYNLRQILNSSDFSWSVSHFIFKYLTIKLKCKFKRRICISNTTKPRWNSINTSRNRVFDRFHIPDFFRIFIKCYFWNQM